MSELMTGGYNNDPNPLSGVVGNWLGDRREYRKNSRLLNEQHQYRSIESAQMHQYNLERDYAKANIDSSMSKQEHRQRKSEATHASKTVMEMSGGRPVANVTLPGGISATFAEPKKAKRKKNNNPGFAPPTTAPSPTGPSSHAGPQFSHSYNAHQAQSGEPHPQRFGV